MDGSGGSDQKVGGSPLRGPWLNALEQLDKGRREETRAAVDTALRASGGGARFEAIAGRLLLIAGDFGGAVRAVARAEATASAPEERYLASVARAFAAGMLGDFAAAIAAFDDLVGVDAPLSLLFAALQLSVSVEASETGLRWAKRIAAHPAAKPDHLLRLADLLHRAGEDEEASAILRGEFGGAQWSSVDGHKVAQLLLSCRACDEAAELFRRQIAEGSGGAVVADAHLGLATIHIWRGETDDADRHARRALEFGGNALAIRRVLAAVALLEGRAGEALTLLDALTSQWPADAETRAWRAEALLRCGQLKAALDEVRVAGDLSPDSSTYVVLHIIAALAALRLGRRPDGDLMVARAVAVLCGERESARVRSLVRRVFVGSGLSIDRALAIGSRLLRSAGVPAPVVDDPAVIESILETALVELGGNRTHGTPTRIHGGRLMPLVVAPPPRSEVTAALHAVRIGGYAEAHRRLGILMQRYPDWPHPWFYRAELLMWMGLLDDARRDLEVALAKRVRDPEERGQWPGIGLAGVHVLQGRPREALRTLERAARRFSGPPAQPYFAWRGEILRALGRLDEARAVLELVCPPGGCRLGSWITLALTCRDLGDRDRPRQVLANLVEQAPGLMIEVTRSAADDETIRAALETPGALARLSDDETRELLERALGAMRGNRSASCLTFVDASNRLRAIPPGGSYRFVNRPDELKELRAVLAAP